jgi:hypothetical protein
MQWVKIRSWHAVKLVRTSQADTLCGRISSGEVRDELPAERSCETCLRIVARRADG